MFDSDPQAETAWKDAIPIAKGPETTVEGLSLCYTFTATVRITVEGRLILRAGGTHYDKSALCMVPNQYDRDPGGTRVWRPRYAFALPFTLANMSVEVNKVQLGLIGVNEEDLPRDFLAIHDAPLCTWAPQTLARFGSYVASLNR